VLFKRIRDPEPGIRDPAWWLRNGQRTPDNGSRHRKWSRHCCIPKRHRISLHDCGINGAIIFCGNSLPALRRRHSEDRYRV